MGRFSGFALACSFFMGSAITVAAAYFLLEEKKLLQQLMGKDDEEEQEETKSGQLLRAQSRSVHFSSEQEQISFLSDIIAQLWSYINVAGGETIKETVEPMFAEMMPKPFTNTRFTKVDLGRVPIRMDNIVVHELKDGCVQFDLDVIWVTDCDIKLKADILGTFGVNRIELEGRMSFLMKPLVAELPIVSAIQYSFVNLPRLDLSYSGLAQLANFSLVDNAIRKILEESLNSMIVLPHRMLYKMDPGSDFLGAYQPLLGIARVTILSGKGFVIEKRTFGKDDIPDVYCNVKLGGRSLRTKTIKDNLTPVWKDEYMDFCLSDYDQVLDIEVWDEDGGAMDPDDFLGETKISVGDIMLDGKTTTIELLEKDKKGTGAFLTLRCDVYKLTPSLRSFEAKTKRPNLLCGVLVVLVKRAFDLPVARKDASSFVKVNFLQSEFVTSVIVDYPGIDALNPFYDAAFEIPLTTDMIANKDNAVVLTLINGTSIIGTAKVTLATLQMTAEKEVYEKRAIGGKNSLPLLEFRVQVRGMDVPLGSEVKSPTRTKQEITPIKKLPQAVTKSTPVPPPPPLQESPATAALPKIRITALEGLGFKARKRRMRKDDIPDVYLKIRFGSSPQVWRTATIKNDMNPKWNESTEYRLSDRGQVIHADVYDENKRSEDDFLGFVRVAVGKILLEGGEMQLEIQNNGTGTNNFIKLGCELLES
mmetsp:Transcript_37147/g.57062  ORF Transcript_37147/g.57062 Transcript_37147/m.57062 type:complete len:703 (-) Transcript_37147:119-2227(-)